MTSHDKRWIIERYPSYSQQLDCDVYSYGCPELDLMGYENITELMIRINWRIKEIEMGDFKPKNYY